MTNLEYNGVLLTNVKTKVYKKEYISNGPQYIYTRITLLVEGYYNPSLTSYVRPAFTQTVAKAPRTGPEATISMGPQTDIAIRHRLALPRKRLIYSVGGTDLVDSDVNEDCTQGPFPKVHDVEEVQGLRTFKIRFEVRTDINEFHTDLFHRLPNLLSHVWEISEDLDQDYFSTITIKGRVVFRGTTGNPLPGQIALGINLADQSWRTFLAPPKFIGWHRDVLKWRLSGDGTTLEYLCVDRQVTWSVPLRIFPRISRIEVVESRSDQYPGVEEVLGAIGSGLAAGAARSVFPGATRGNIALTTIGAGLLAGWAQRPITTYSVTARAWGKPHSDLMVVRNCAVFWGVRYLANVGVQVAGVNIPVAQRGSVSIDRTGRFAEATLTKIVSFNFSPWVFPIESEVAGAGGQAADAGWNVPPPLVEWGDIVAPAYGSVDESSPPDPVGGGRARGPFGTGPAQSE